MPDCPPEILDLVERFDQNRDSYLLPSFNETELRVTFVNPFFEALGWDVHNKQGYAEAYKDVVHEDAIRVGGATKAPDYCFRIGGARKFFVETKKPSINLKKDPEPAYQLRRYAWSAKLPLSILTNFEEFAVYNCRSRPNKTDPALKERTKFIRYDEYADRWDEIAGIFSREAILKGSFDRYAETKKKRGTAEVDDAFLAEIEKWRDLLARNFALRNKLSVRELNYAVACTIDRIIFLRMCEDRGVEHYGQLQGLLNGQRVYRRLFELFERADDRYNSGLFHFHPERGRTETPDELTPKLKLDDKPLKQILRGLYYPDSPYEFSVLPADVLGQVYEQFLGKVIRLTPGGYAKVEDKPEVKKAGGVYYTPTYIVDYIVKNAVGKLLEGKTLRQVRKLRILDPACGSGSFLVAAYQYLLDWHRDRCLKEGPQKHRKVLYQGRGGQWLLTTQEKKRILLDNLYGVDIDSQAVEVTKLSLLLKVLKGATRETLEHQRRFLHERALPDLSSNVKCGNSLIGPDFYDGRQMSLLDDDEHDRINAFDWKAEFPKIMKSGGFDAVIGNPPYVRMELFKTLKSYLRDHYRSHGERTDLYVYFVEKSVGLLRNGGIYGVIVSNKWIRSAYGEKLRKFLSDNTTLTHLIDFGELPVFQRAAAMPAVLTAVKRIPMRPYTYTFCPAFERPDFDEIAAGAVSLEAAESRHCLQISSQGLSGEQWRLVRPDTEKLLQKLEDRGVPLIEYTGGRIRYGIKSGAVKAFVIDDEVRKCLIQESPCAEGLIKPYVVGDDVRNYNIRDRGRYLIYTHHGVDMTGRDSVLKYLRQFKSQLEGRATRQRWYELQQPQYGYRCDYESEKIIFPDIAKESRFALDRQHLYPADTTFVIPIPDLYLLGILNSKLAFFYLGAVCPVLGDSRQGGRLRMKLNYVGKLPIHRPDLSNRKQKTQSEQISRLARRMMKLHEKIGDLKTSDEKVRIRRRMQATDSEIDRLVYELYGLTDEEIALVEEDSP